MNDVALQNDDALQYTGMQFDNGELSERLLMVRAEWLYEHQGTLDDAAQVLLTRALADCFGVAAA